MKKKIFKLFTILLIILISYITFGFNASNAETVKTMKIVIDPGHGGHETGAINYTDGIMEKDINLKTSRYLKDYLEDYYGVEIIMTHDGLDSNTEMSIVDRGMVARNNNADLLLCLHYNAASAGNSWNGAEVYVTANKSCYKYNQESTEIGNLILRNLSNLGLFSRGVKTRLCQDTGPKWEYSDGSKADYYGIIRYAMKGNAEDRGLDITSGAGITSILIEHCFISGSDVQFINTDAKLQKLAQADGRAIVEHYGLKLKKDVVAELILNKTSVNMIVGDKTKIDYTINPSTAINKKVNWQASDSKIATVDENGNITAVGEGTATITATADGNDKVSSKVQVKVTNPNITIQNGERASMLEGSKMQLFTDTGAIDSKITFKSSNEDILKVDENGLVSGAKVGTAKITATYEQYKKTASIEITVNKLNENETIEIKDYKETNGVISNFARETNSAEFAKHIKVTGDLKVKVDIENFVGSGTKIQIYKGDECLQTYICKLYGDVNGDGKISAVDYVKIKNHILKYKILTDDISCSVADVSNDNKISALDYVKIKNDILNVKKLELR